MIKLLGRIAVFINLAVCGLDLVFGAWGNALFCGLVAALLIFCGALDDDT